MKHPETLSLLIEETTFTANKSLIQVLSFKALGKEIALIARGAKSEQRISKVRK